MCMQHGRLLAGHVAAEASSRDLHMSLQQLATDIDMTAAPECAKND